MTRRLAEAGQGTGEAKDAIRELGLSAADLAAARPEDAFRQIATELATIPNQADRVRLAFKFFDSEGVGLVNLTTDALDEANAALAAMGGHLSRVDVSRVEQMNDSFLKSGRLLQTLGDRIVVRLADPLRIASDQFFNAATQGDQLNGIIEKVAGTATRSLGSLLTFSGRAINFVSGNAALVEFGILGFLVGGRKGLAIGSAIGGLFQQVRKGFEDATGGVQGRMEAWIRITERQIKLVQDAEGQRR